MSAKNPRNFTILTSFIKAWIPSWRNEVPKPLFQLWPPPVSSWLHFLLSQWWQTKITLVFHMMVRKKWAVLRIGVPLIAWEISWRNEVNCYPLFNQKFLDFNIREFFKSCHVNLPSSIGKGFKLPFSLGFLTIFTLELYFQYRFRPWRNEKKMWRNENCIFGYQI